MGILTQQNIDDILRNNTKDPFAILGMHWEKEGISVRAFAPEARSIVIAEAGSGEAVCIMTRVRDEGIFEAAFSYRKEFFRYELITPLID